jgi:hypothetical protein
MPAGRTMTASRSRRSSGEKTKHIQALRVPCNFPKSGLAAGPKNTYFTG